MEYVFWIYRQVFSCKRSVLKYFDIADENVIEPEVSMSDIPWLWIGARKNENETETVTNLVNKFISYNKKIDASFLEELTGLKDVTWRYVCTKSLEERDFPSEGILIEKC